jgi:hypothetical protein
MGYSGTNLFPGHHTGNTVQLLSAKFNKQAVDLFRHVLTTTYFFYDVSFYDQKDGVAKGSPLAPVIAKFYMEHFEQKASNQEASQMVQIRG